MPQALAQSPCTYFHHGSWPVRKSVSVLQLADSNVSNTLKNCLPDSTTFEGIYQTAPQSEPCCTQTGTRHLHVQKAFGSMARPRERFQQKRLLPSDTCHKLANLLADD